MRPSINGSGFFKEALLLSRSVLGFDRVCIMDDESTYCTRFLFLGNVFFFMQTAKAGASFNT